MLQLARLTSINTNGKVSTTNLISETISRDLRVQCDVASQWATTDATEDYNALAKFQRLALENINDSLVTNRVKNSNTRYKQEKLHKEASHENGLLFL